MNALVPEPRMDAAPVLENGRYVFRMGELELEVDPAIGGRVTRFGLGSANVLTGPEVVRDGAGSVPNMYGSTFWTSPQSDWGWPPEPAIDSEPYQSSIDGPVLLLASQPGATTGYAVQKRIWAEPARARLALEYRLVNRRARLPAAPWEISRVPKEGLVFFPASTPALPQSTLPSELHGGVAWVDVARAPSVDSKLFQDGSEGWLAYAYRDLVFVKAFDDIPRAEQAPGEAEIEIFVSGQHDYVEVEQQGRHALPAAGTAAAWRVYWALLRRPAQLAASVGNSELVDWVRSQVGGAARAR